MKQQGVKSEEIGLGGLAGVFSSDDHSCIYLVDHTGNAYTFFKYKAKLIDVASLIMEASLTGNKDKAIEDIRKGLAYGMKGDEQVIFHVGELGHDIDEFLKGQSFWKPEQLFRSPDKLDNNWFRENVSKPEDKDAFGKEGPLFPGDKYTLYVSLSKDIKFEDVKWLEGCAKNFRGITIK